LNPQVQSYFTVLVILPNCFPLPSSRLPQNISPRAEFSRDTSNFWFVVRISRIRFFFFQLIFLLRTTVHLFVFFSSWFGRGPLLLVNLLSRRSLPFGLTLDLSPFKRFLCPAKLGRPPFFSHSSPIMYTPCLDLWG